MSRIQQSSQGFAVPAKSKAGNQRIEELRSRKPTDISHGDALLLQGLAVASFREQRLPELKPDRR